MRIALKTREQEQRLEWETHKKQSLEMKLDLIAGKNHHLLGTKAVPGVYARVRLNSATIDKLDAIEGGNGSRAEKFSLAIPESKLRTSTELRRWISNNIIKNPRDIQLRHTSAADRYDSLSEEEKRKGFQGPFLPKFQLLERKNKPLHPTLRVQTDYYDTPNHLREEKRTDAYLRGN